MTIGEPVLIKMNRNEWARGRVIGRNWYDQPIVQFTIHYLGSNGEFRRVGEEEAFNEESLTPIGVQGAD